MTTTLSANTQTLLQKRLWHEEGFRQFPYRDTNGHLSIGIGRNLDAIGISLDEAFLMLANDIGAAEHDLVADFPWYVHLDDPRKSVLIDMCFNLGIGKLKTFAEFLLACSRFDWTNASREMLLSAWAREVGDRAIYLANVMRNGIL